MRKTCTKCLIELDAAQFTKRAASVDGLSYRCRSCAGAQAKARYRADPGPAKERAKRWADANPKARRKIADQWEGRNLERCRARKAKASADARKANPEKARLDGLIAAQKRRHRVNANHSAPLASVVARLLRRAAGRCTYCLGQFGKLTVDHFHPVSKGGGGQGWNLVPCCQPCNSSKRDSDGPAWIERRFGLRRLVEVVWLLESLSAARLP
jgi:5-methylcytosine-specific restriction endonuclease McrA